LGTRSPTLGKREDGAAQGAWRQNLWSLHRPQRVLVVPAMLMQTAQPVPSVTTPLVQIAFLVTIATALLANKPQALACVLLIVRAAFVRSVRLVNTSISFRLVPKFMVRWLGGWLGGLVAWWLGLVWSDHKQDISLKVDNFFSPASFIHTYIRTTLDCNNKPDESLCDDLDPCTTNDTCVAQTCIPVFL
jgi:hypothetical protein